MRNLNYVFLHFVQSLRTKTYSDMRISVFPGSFDPFTTGHLDILRRALGISDKVIIAVGNNHLKKGMFSIGDRVDIIRESIAPLIGEGADIEVTCYSGMTVDFCREVGAGIIVRGVRTTADFENETIIAQANKQLDNSIQTVFFPADCGNSFVSSTVVRDILINGGDTSGFICEGIDIKKYLKNRQEPVLK